MLSSTLIRKFLFSSLALSLYLSLSLSLFSDRFVMEGRPAISANWLNDHQARFCAMMATVHLLDLASMFILKQSEALESGSSACTWPPYARQAPFYRHFHTSYSTHTATRCIYIHCIYWCIYYRRISTQQVISAHLSWSCSYIFYKIIAWTSSWSKSAMLELSKVHITVTTQCIKIN